MKTDWNSCREALKMLLISFYTQRVCAQSIVWNTQSFKQSCTAAAQETTTKIYCGIPISYLFINFALYHLVNSIIWFHGPFVRLLYSILQ